MRTNPLAERIRDRLQPQFAAFADPLHPDRVLVARRGRDGRPEQDKVVATIEKRGELDLFNPIFRHPPASPGQWQMDWEFPYRTVSSSGTLARRSWATNSSTAFTSDSSTPSNHSMKS